MITDDLLYRIGIGSIPLIGSKNAKKLIAYTGSAQALFQEKKSSLLKIPGIGESIAGQIVNSNTLEMAENEIRFIQKHNINPLFYLDDDYPVRLKHCEDGPVILYAKGNVDFNQSKVLSIVGTRNASRYGKEKCDEIVKELAKRHKQVLIVSGLAYGIDVSAHKAALQNDLPTVGVLGHGLSTIYPRVHTEIAQRMVNNGALISEFVNDVGPDKPNFVKRNRIIAGMADATLVVESATSGGALITADIANSYNRDVFALPGRSKDTYSAGCNKLIKTNKAALIENVLDIEYNLGWDIEDDKPKSSQRKLFVTLQPEEEVIHTILREKGDLTIDLLCLEADMPVSKVSALLLNMEFSGVVRSLPGKIYAAIG